MTDAKQIAELARKVGARIVNTFGMKKVIWVRYGREWVYSDHGSLDGSLLSFAETARRHLDRNA